MIAAMSLVPPRKIDPSVEDQLLAKLASGRTLTSICREPGMPTREVVYSNLKSDPDFAERFRAAREMSCDALAEQVIDFVDAKPERTAKGLVDAGYVAWNRLRMDARLKLLPKWDKRYAEKVDHTLGNREGESLKVDSNIDTAALTAQLASALRAQKGGSDGQKDG